MCECIPAVFLCFRLDVALQDFAAAYGRMDGTGREVGVSLVTWDL